MMTKAKSVELVVIGAGPAGLGAAIAAAEQGVETILIDSFTQPGGQYFMQTPAAFSSQKGTGMEEKGKTYIEKLAGLPVKVITKTLVWGIFEEEGEIPWRVALYGPNGVPCYARAKNIILANGAYDTPVAFPGWTLPGVMTCGAALILLKTYRVAPGVRALVTGTGPLLLSVAAHLIEAGVEVTAICEANRLFPKGFLHLPTMLGHWNRVWEGIQYASRIFPAGTPYKTGWSILSASGQERVEQAVITRLDRAGRPVGKPQTLAVDLVISGYNLTPNTGLARMVDCELAYRPEKGGWIPVRDEDMRASKPGMYVVGDGGGIGGADNALLEGQIAGVSVALETGHLPSESAEKIRRALHRKRRDQLRFGRLYSDLFTPPSGLVALAEDETVLCRCEEVTLGQVKEAVQMGAATLKEVKMATRCGMGNCQGRMCERPVSAAIVESLPGEAARHERVGHYSIRPPLGPLPAQFLADAQVEMGGQDS